MQNQDSRLRLKTSAIEDIYLCTALDFDLSHSWPSMAFEVLLIVIHVIIAVVSLSVPMVIPGNSIDPRSDICLGFKHVQLIQLMFNWLIIHKQL